MLRVACAVLFLSSAGVAGCGDGADSGGTGGTMLEPGPTCTSFCANVVGTCEAFSVSEASCRQGCESNLLEERAKSESCGDAVEAVFQCAAELDCEGVYAFRDREPLDSYPCRSEVASVDAACPAN